MAGFCGIIKFLRSNGIDHLNQEALQNILEGTVATSKREINGQFTTPTELAKILARLTVKDWADAVLDCCCGTGTIPKEVIRIKSHKCLQRMRLNRYGRATKIITLCKSLILA